MKVLITGSAGFIGFNFSEYLLKKNYYVIGIDNINDYYSQKLKKDRLKILKKFKNFKFYKIDLIDRIKIEKIFLKNKFDFVFHFAAQAGVRYSVDNPNAYIDSNIVGFYNILEMVKKKKIKKFYYASSSSVYGNSKKFPLKEKQTLLPTNTYSLTKKFNEDLSEIFKKYYNINSIGIRFFTVYGEWGRPDMFYTKAIEAGLKKKKLYINNYGNHARDFTYIKDVNLILFNLMKNKISTDNSVINICSNHPINIVKIVKYIEKYTSKINIKKRNIQLADVLKTHGSNHRIIRNRLIKKFTNFDQGIKNTIKWYKKYHNI